MGSEGESLVNQKGSSDSHRSDHTGSSAHKDCSARLAFSFYYRPEPRRLGATSIDLEEKVGGAEMQATCQFNGEIGDAIAIDVAENHCLGWITYVDH